jgi:hypothetical protein
MCIDWDAVRQFFIVFFLSMALTLPLSALLLNWKDEDKK